ncbi:MAG: hypothetical protein RLO81_02395 [Fulvivirga sp.]|uniref:hypothetical protein n=1 Tax=Fulvivirga sp. TaxID=1931237 RepID=UPI0032EDD53B
MKNMKNWLVELNAAVLSTEAMNNIIMLANQLKPEKIHFLHIARQVELPSELESEFPDLQQVELKSVSEKIQDKVGLQLPKETKCIVTTKIGNSLRNYSIRLKKKIQM